MNELIGSCSSEEGEELALEVLVAGSSYRVCVAESDANAQRKTLFATHLWQGARVLGAALHEAYSAEPRLHGQSVLELGAGAGLPSLVALSLGARVVATDFPAPLVLDTLARNLLAHKQRLGDSSRTRACAAEHMWGSDVSPLLALNGGRFDLALAAECLWRHETHPLLLASLAACLREGGKAIVTFSHHIPGLEMADLNFFVLATEQFGFDVLTKASCLAPHMWSEGKQVTMFTYTLMRR